ncbi:MAG: LamG domain-containing protein, partial [Candidatus Peribacteraceae bacterium]
MEAIGPRKMLLSAKDASRKQTVRELQNALTQYQIEEGTLPNAQSIIMADDGAKPICKQGVTTDATCVNLDALIPEYIAALPQDTSETNANYTGYKVYREPLGGRPAVASAYVGGYAEGRMGYWRFFEGAGTTVADSSGNNVTGTFVNNVQWTEGRTGKGARIDNISSGISVARNFVGLEDYTFAAWVNLKGNHKNYTGTIMSSGDWNTSHWAFGISQTNTSLQVRGPTLSRNYSFSLNTWYHVCAVRAANKVTFYVNGSPIGSLTASTNTLVSNAANTMIGRETYAGGYFSFNGIIDDAAVYNRALSDYEVKLLAGNQLY